MFSCFLSLKSRLRRTRSTQHKQFPERRSHPVLQMSLRRQPTLSACLSAAHLTIQTIKNCICSAKNVFHLVKCQSQREACFCIFLGSPFFTSEHWGTNHTQFTYTLCTLPCTWGSPAHHISINSPCISFCQICTFFVSLSTSFSTASEANLIHSLIPPLLFLLS